MASSILIVKLSSMGDVLHTLPAAQAIRAAFPDIRLGWAVERAHAQLLERQKWLDEVIVWDRKNLATFFKFSKALRATRWEVAIDFQGLFRSGLVTRLCGAAVRIGYHPSKELAHHFYTERVPLATMDRHAVDRSLDLAERLGAKFAADSGAESGGDQLRLFPLHPSQQDIRAVDSWCRQHRFHPSSHRLVILNPHCRKDANRWPAERFAALAQNLLSHAGVRVALSGGPIAGELCERIAAAAPERIWRADGRFSLLGSAELFSRAAAVVTGDTGPMHIAVAVDAPVVALFGPANPTRTGPYSKDAVVISAGLACAPCFARRCPLGHDPPLCMESIGVDQVTAAVVKQMDRFRDRRVARRSA